MTNLTIARRYAQALYEEASSLQSVEKVDEDIAMIREALDHSNELALFFASPIISRNRKEAVVEALFAERVQPVTYHFMRLLIEKQREDMFPAVVSAWQVLRDEQRGVVEAQTRVAFPLQEEEQQQLVRALERLSGSKVRLRIAQDPTLLGGLIVRIGDTVYDGSVRQQLANLRDRLKHGNAALN